MDFDSTAGKDDYIVSDLMFRNWNLPLGSHGTSTYRVPLPFGFGTTFDLVFLPMPEGTDFSGDSVFRDKVF